MLMHKSGRLVRLLTASGTTALLLTACGTGDGQAATPLTEKQTKAALPDGEALPGWKTKLKPEAMPTKGAAKSTACRGKDEACKGSRFYGASSSIRDDKQVMADFTLLAYKDDKAAKAGYDVLWKDQQRAVGTKATKPKVDFGDRSDARLGTVGFEGARGAVVQLRVGANLAWVHIRGASKNAFTETLMKDLAKVLTARTQEAQSGKTPSTSLD